MSVTESTFAEPTTRPLLAQACQQLNLDPVGADLLRHHTNAVYRLATADVVVKVTRPGVRHVAAMVKLVRWIDQQGVPTVRLLDVDQPLHIAGCDVTLWHYLPQHRSTITADDIAGPLAALHRLPNPPVALPTLDAEAAIRRSIATSNILSAQQREVLHQRCSALAQALHDVTLTLPTGVIHGDPQHRNTLHDHARRRNCQDLWMKIF